MKLIRIVSKIEPLNLLDKIFWYVFLKKWVPLEGHVCNFKITFSPQNEEAHTKYIVEYEILQQAPTQTRRMKTLKPIIIDFTNGSRTSSWTSNLPTSGLFEFRVYIQNLTDEDIVFDELGGEQRYKKENLRYYMKIYKSYSLLELFVLILAIISGLGAVFEVLNYFKPIIG